MNGHDEFANYGDPETDPDAALLDHELRQFLNDIPDSANAGAHLPPDAASEIAHAVNLAWPDGRPPTVDELGADDYQKQTPDECADFGLHHGDGLHGDHFGHEHEQGHDHTGHDDYGHHDYGSS